DDPEIRDGIAAHPPRITEFERDRHDYSQFWLRSSDLLRRLPPKAKRSSADAGAAETLLTAARDHRERFLSAHGGTVYDLLTRDRSVFMRVEELVLEAARLVPGLTPTRDEERPE